MTAELRRRRLDLGLSQAEFAETAGVSRALVGAVEQGRHVPSVDAAMRIAQALGTSVEALFAPAAPPAPRAALAVLGGALGHGEPVRVGEVAGRVVAAALDRDEWAAPDGVAERGGVRLFAGAPPRGLVVAGCDPALGVAAALLGSE